MKARMLPPPIVRKKTVTTDSEIKLSKTHLIELLRRLFPEMPDDTVIEFNVLSGCDYIRLCRRFRG